MDKHAPQLNRQYVFCMPDILLTHMEAPLTGGFLQSAVIHHLALLISLTYIYVCIMNAITISLRL